VDARVALPLGLVALAAGCGSSPHAPSVASLGTTPTTSSASKALVPDGGSFVPFVRCMNRHGVAAQLGPQGHGVSIGDDANGPQFAAAQRACQKWMPGGGPPKLTPAQQAQREKDLLALAKCMRRHGVPNFPDPDGQGDLSFPSTVDPNSPSFQNAMTVCRQAVRTMKGPRMFR
jgi:hypothetical protein